MRVALLTWDWPSFAGGGVAALSHTLASALAAGGDEVEVWTRGGGARSAGLRESGPPGVRVVGIPGRSWRRKGTTHLTRGLPAHLARFRPELVVVTPWDGLPGALVAGLDPVRTLVFAHGRDITGDPGADRRALRADVLADPRLRWLCLTPWLQAELTAAGAAATVVPAAVPVPPPCPPGEPGRWMALGRLIPRKGQAVAVEAVGLLLAEGRDVRLDVVGEGPERPAVEAAAARWGDRVVVHGAVSDARREELWARCSGLVLPCRDGEAGEREGFGLVFTEAGARGRPVVAGRAGGVSAAVDHGVTGLLVDSSGDPRAVADALAAVLDGDGSAMGAAGRRRWADRHRPGHLAAAVRAAAAERIQGNRRGAASGEARL